MFLQRLHRKKTKQLMEQTADRFNIDTTEIVNKHNKRWATKFSNVSEQIRWHHWCLLSIICVFV